MKRSCDHSVTVHWFSNHHNDDRLLFLNKPLQPFPQHYTGIHDNSWLSAVVPIVAVVVPVDLPLQWARLHLEKENISRGIQSCSSLSNQKLLQIQSSLQWSRWFTGQWYNFLMQNVVQCLVRCILVCNICIMLMYRWREWRLLFVLPGPVPGNSGHQHGWYHALLLPGWGLCKHLHWFLTQRGLLLRICAPSGGHSHTLDHFHLIVALVDE